MGDVDIQDQIIHYYNPLRRAHAWFKKFGINLCFRLLLNAYFCFKREKKPTADFLTFVKASVLWLTSKPCEKAIHRIHIIATVLLRALLLSLSPLRSTLVFKFHLLNPRRIQPNDAEYASRRPESGEKPDFTAPNAQGHLDFAILHLFWNTTNKTSHMFTCIEYLRCIFHFNILRNRCFRVISELFENWLWVHIGRFVAKFCTKCEKSKFSIYRRIGSAPQMTTRR